MPHHKHHLRHFHRDANAAPGAQQQNDGVATLVSVVFVTATPTFSGPIAGFTTLDAHSVESVSPTPSSNTPFNTPSNTPVSSPSDSKQQSSVATSSQPLSQAQASSSSAQQPTLSSAVVGTTSTADSPSKSSSDSISNTSRAIAAQASPTTGDQSSVASVDAASATSSSTPTTLSKSSSSGMSGGAKAGLAIGILLGVAALLALGLFFYRRKKKQQNELYEETAGEKNPFGDEASAAVPARAPSTHSVKSSSTPPTLSLRPVTQFEPDLTAQGKSNNATGTGYPYNTATPPNNRDLEKSRMLTQAENPANPFGSLAEASDQPSKPTRASPATVNNEVPAPLRVRTPSPETAEFGTGTPAIGAATVAQRHNAPKALDLRSSRSDSPAPRTPMQAATPSPVGTEFSLSSVSPGPGSNGPPASNVHRIQLDFKPSMDDEIELRAGQLVRLLHEYDDGWALCIRLDRSQQGVAPRTCLSARPVKPRPNGPTRGPAQRGPPVQVSKSQTQLRPVSPIGDSVSTDPSIGPPSPLSPGPVEQHLTSSGSKTVGPQRPTPSLLANPSAQSTQESPSPVTPRKPVPGQAM